MLNDCGTLVELAVSQLLVHEYSSRQRNWFHIGGLPSFNVISVILLHQSVGARGRA
jgi:hypothetical protein